VGASAAITEITPAISTTKDATARFFVFMDSYELICRRERHTHTAPEECITQTNIKKG
jgi:hypothetical protein